MGAFVINRNNEITAYLPELKKLAKTSNNTTAIYNAVEDLITFFYPEHKRLKEVEKKYTELRNALNERETVDNMLKKFISHEDVSNIEN